MSTPPVTRGLIGLFAAIFAGGLSVAFLIVAFSHMNTPLMFMAYLTALPLYLAGLGAGSLAGLVATTVGTLTLYATQPANIAVFYTLLIGIPTVGLTMLALRFRVGADQQVHWYPEGNLLTAITIYPCVLFLTAVAAATKHEGGLLALTQESFDQAGTKLAEKFNADEIDAFHAMMANAAKIAPAMGSYVWVFVTIFSIGGAQYILKRQQMTLRGNFNIQSLHVPVWLIYAVAATGLFGVYGGAPYDYIGRNLSLILGLPFFFVGVAVVHSLAVTMRRSGIILFVFYALMTFIPWVALIVAAVGVIDQWVNFRARITHKTTV